MGDGDPRPVEHLLGDPVVPGGVALGVLPGGDLRHVNDCLDPGLPSRLGEVGRRLDDPGADRVDEVRPADALYRRTHRIQVEVVAGDHLHARVFEPLRAVVEAVDEGPDLVAFLQQLLDRVPAGVARCPGDQELCRVHPESSGKPVNMSLDI